MRLSDREVRALCRAGFGEMTLGEVALFYAFLLILAKRGDA